MKSKKVCFPIVPFFNKFKHTHTIIMKIEYYMVLLNQIIKKKEESCTQNLAFFASVRKFKFLPHFLFDKVLLIHFQLNKRSIIKNCWSRVFIYLFIFDFLTFSKKSKGSNFVVSLLQSKSGREKKNKKLPRISRLEYSMTYIFKV